MFLMNDDPIWLSAQEAAERMQTIKTAGWVLSLSAILAFIIILCLIRKNKKEKEAENATRNDEIAVEKSRIESTERIGIAMAEAMKTDSYWKAKFIETVKENTSLKEENEGLKSTMEMAGIEDVAEFREWLKNKKEVA
jgi:hypothetical protein